MSHERCPRYRLGCHHGNCCGAALLLTVVGESRLNIVPLFANGRVLTVYILATVPLSWALAKRFLSGTSSIIVLSTSLLCLSVLLWPGVSDVLGQNRAGVITRNLIRSLVVGCLVFPICWQLASADRTPQPLTRFNGLETLVIAAICCVVLPAIYVQSTARALRETLQQQMDRGRVVQELRNLATYWELYGDGQIGVQRVSARLKELNRQYRQLVAAVSAVDANSASASLTLNSCRCVSWR